MRPGRHLDLARWPLVSSKYSLSCAKSTTDMVNVGIPAISNTYLSMPIRLRKALLAGSCELDDHIISRDISVILPLAYPK